MALSALRGAVGFLTRLPVGHDERAWTAFSASPVAAVPVGYLVGACLALPFVAAASAPVALPATVVAVAYLVATYGLTGITHLDGVADCGDAAVVHGDAERRREVLKDTTTGVGAVAAVSLVVAGLALAAVAVSWARSRLGGVSGDVFGATNELARLVGLHVGVIAWTLS